MSRRGFAQFARIASIFITAALAACSAPKVQTLHGYAGAALPPPGRVVVYDFSLSPDQVQLDQGVRARLTRANSGTPDSVTRMRVAQETQDVLADELTRRLQSYGLPAERLPEGVPPPQGALLVRGQVFALSQGNRTRRLVIGFGAGQSSITAEAQLYTVSGGGVPRLIQDFHGNSNSGRMPGAAGTMGAGAAAGRIATSAAMSGAMHTGNEFRRTSDDANALRLADALATKIGGFATSQGWIAPEAIH